MQRHDANRQRQWLALPVHSVLLATTVAHKQLDACAIRFEAREP